MNYLKCFKKIVPIAVISALSLNSVVLAQSAERYVNVGNDSDGDPFLLDITTMGKIEQGFGRVIKIYQVKNDLMSEMLIRTSCGESRLRVVGFRTYNRDGVQLTEEKQRQELQIEAGSPASESMRYYCRSIGAYGW